MELQNDNTILLWIVIKLDWMPSTKRWEQYALALYIISVSITDHRPAVSCASTIPVQQKCHWSQPNTSGPAGIKISQCPVKWLSLLRPRWTDSCCTPWSIIIPSSVAVGQLCSVKQVATVPSSPCTSPSSPPCAERWQNGQMGEEWE